MPNNIDNLLKKKGWTGKEVGKLLIASMLNDIKQQGNPDKQPLFSQKDFERMESSLTSDSDYTIYGVYRDLYSSIIDSFNRGSGLNQQFFNGYYRLLVELRELQNAEQALKSLDDTPVIMTESQYKRLEAEATAFLRGNKDSYYTILFFTLEKFLEAGDEAPEPIRKAIEATKEEPAASKSFSRSYNELMGEGYYQLPDGRRSDQMTSEEWQKALAEEFTKRHGDSDSSNLAELLQNRNFARLLKSYELYFKGADAIRAYLEENGAYTKETPDEDLEAAIEDVINTISTAHLNPVAEELAELLDYVTPTEWHTYEELPEGLTAYDLLDLITDSSGYAETDEKKHLQAFKTEYKELYTALAAYIEELLPQARGLKANQLYKDIASWGELADAGIIGYKELITPSNRELIDPERRGWDSGEYNARYRCFSNGIAILQNPASSQVDENGDYKEPEIQLFSFANTFERLENAPEEAEKIAEYANKLMYPALSYLYAFNALMEIFSKVYDLPELAQVAIFDTSDYEERIDAFNNMLYLLYHDVYGDKEEREHKRSIIKGVFFPLDAETLKPTQEAIDAVTEELTKLGLSTEARKKLKYLDELIENLRNSGEGAC